MIHKAKKIDTGDWVVGYFEDKEIDDTGEEWPPIIRDLKDRFLHQIDPSTLCEKVRGTDATLVLFEGDEVENEDGNIGFVEWSTKNFAWVVKPTGIDITYVFSYSNWKTTGRNKHD